MHCHVRVSIVQSLGIWRIIPKKARGGRHHMPALVGYHLSFDRNARMKVRYGGELRSMLTLPRDGTLMLPPNVFRYRVSFVPISEA